MRRPSVRRLALASTALALTLPLPAASRAANCTWTGGAGDWSSAGMWSCGVVPGSGDTGMIDGGNPITSAVTINGSSQSIATLTIDAGDSLSIGNGSLSVSGGSLVNNGLVALGTNSQLIGTGGNLDITGTGSITLSDVGNGGAYLYATNGNQLTIEGGQTVSGTGYVGNDQGVVINNGVINATSTQGPPGLVLNSQGGNGGVSGGVGANGTSAFLNSGTLEATGGGLLRLQSGTYENTATGQISATGAGSIVQIESDARIIGGTLTSGNGGVINTTGGTEYLQNVTLGSGTTFNIGQDNEVRINGGLTNNGTIALDGTNGSVYLNTETSAAITGTGKITLNDTGNGAPALFAINGQTLTLGSGQTVSGNGDIGNDQGVTINNGVINATPGTGNGAGVHLRIDGQGGSGGVSSGLGSTGTVAFLNTGLIEATGGGTLDVIQGQYENQGSGSFLATGAGSTINITSDARIIGGTLTSSNGGVINTTGGTEYLQNVTLGSGTTFNIGQDNEVRINGGLTNNGTIALNGASGTPYLDTESAAVTIDGTGTITLTSVTNAGNADLFAHNGQSLTIGSGQTVVGDGSVGVDQGVLINNGTINATAGTGSNAGIAMTLDAQGGSGGVGTGNGVGTNNNSAFLNNALIEATGGGVINVASGLYENQNAGRFLATGTGSAINLTGDARIVGGTLTSSAGGVFNTTGGTEYLQNVTLGSGTTFNIGQDNVVRINGSLANNGTIALNGTNGSVYLNTETSAAITGTGTITLTDVGNGAPELFAINGQTLTLGSGQTVTGNGDVGADHGVLINNGVIDATPGTGNGAAIALRIDAQGGSSGVGAGNGVGTNNNAAFLNTNLIEATGGGTLEVVNGLYENQGTGRMLADGSGSTISLDNDVRIIGGTVSGTNGGTVKAVGTGTQYLQDVTVGSGTSFAITNDTVRVDNTLTNNGTITIGASGTLVGETAAATLAGTGTVTLADPSAALYDYNGTQLTIGAGQTVRGTGQIGLDQGLIDNQGNILADGAITINSRGGNGGVGAGNGLGADMDVGFYNDNGGQVQANNGGATLTLASGSYEQAAGGSFSVGTGSTFTMGNDSNLTNLQTGGVLSKGLYFAFSDGTMTLRSNQTGSITTIGTDSPGTDTVVTLSGAGSTIQVEPSGDGTVTTIDQSLNTVAQSGKLVLADGRSFTASNGAFSNAGTLSLQNGSFTALSGFSNSGLVTGNGTVGTPVTNSGSVIADGGVLSTQAITGVGANPGGTIGSNAGGTLDLSGATTASTAGFLANNGALALGANNVTVTSDYTNANFGTGNGFNKRADVTGSGLILAASATLDLSGPGLDNNANTLNVGNVRLGGTSSTTLTITNNGTLTTLRGAVESPSSNTVSITSGNYVVGPNGGSTTVNLSYTGTTAGQLTGNTLTVATNFDNVPDRTLTVTGAAYNPAAASLSPNPVDLGATRVGGTLSGSVSITNTAPVSAYSEKLAVNGATGAGGASGTAPAGLINPGTSAASTVSLATGTSGTFSGTVTYALATDGTGTSGLAQAALPSQSVTVNGKVYQAANAELTSNSVTFATVRQGSTAPTATVGVTNSATGALVDTLNTSVVSTPAQVTASAPGGLASGASGNLAFSENTATAGQFGGTATIGFTSTDADLSPLQLQSQNVSFQGTVTQQAVAQILKDLGAGTLSGAGQTYTLDLGSFMAGAGAVTTDLGVLNANLGASYSETLGGTFGATDASGYNFAGMTFSGLQGGQQNMPNELTFNYAGLAAGVYTDTLTFDGYSSYAGLSDLALGPITVNVTATITGGITPPPPPPAVPEASTWAMLTLGFGSLGGVLRRQRRRRTTAAI